MSKESPFATGPIADTIGPYGDDAIVDQIIDGTITHNSLGLTPLDIDRKLNALLQSLQRPHTNEGSPIPDMDDTISLEMYKKLFNKSRETLVRHHQKYKWDIILPLVNMIT